MSGNGASSSSQSAAKGSSNPSGSGSNKNRGNFDPNMTMDPNMRPRPQRPAPKRKAKNQGEDNQKKPRKDARVMRALNELSTWTHDLQSQARGIDHPTGKIITKQWNAPKNCQIVTYMRTGLADVGLGDAPQVWEGWRVRFDLDSQAPGMFLTKGDIEVRIAVPNIRMKNIGEIGDPVFNNMLIESSKLNVNGVKTMFADRFSTSELSNEDAKKLVDFGLSPVASEVGLDCLNFILQRKMHWRVTKLNLKKENRDRQIADAKKLIEVLNSNAIFTLVRKPPTARGELDAYWKHKVRIAVDKKICPFFNKEVDNAMGYTFRKFLDNPDTPLPHQPWMVKAGDPDSVANFKAYASHAARRKFDEGRHWEIILSAALLYEIEYENTCINKYFNFGIKHEAKVIRRHGQYVQLEVSVLRQSETFAMPTIAPNTKMQLRVGDLILDKDDMDVQEEPKAGEENVEMGDNPQVFTGYQYRCKALSKETTKSFVVSVTFDKKDKDANTKFRINSRVNIELEMKRNHLPSSRQMEAIGLIAKADENPDMTPMEKKCAGYLRKFLLGEGAPDLSGTDAQSPLNSNWTSLEKDVQDAFNLYVENTNMNTEQTAAWNSIFYETNMITQIQGPPGTGKTALNVTIALCFALLGSRTVITAPTNKACEGTMQALIKDFQDLCHVFPETKPLFKIVYFPTSATLRDQMLHPDDNELETEADANDMNENVEEARSSKAELKQHMLWTHVENHFIDISEHGKSAPQTKFQADEWLDTLDNIRTGVNINFKARRKFLELGQDAVEAVLTDPDVKVVVTTSNNADQLKRIGFKCQTLIIDECAFGTEQDSCVPLSLNAEWIVLTGDHQQLKPVVQSINHNEYSSQLGLSLFERVLQQDNIPLFRLKVNYRMHPDIASLPGMLSYEWLGCGDATIDPEEDLKDIDEYIQKWWKSNAAAKYRRNRRGPLFDSKPHESIRRLFFNVQNSFSACPEGSTSTVNFANVVAIVDLVISILSEGRPGAWIDVEKISILTPYNGQKEELEKHIQLYMASLGYQRFPKVITIDSMQGGQDAVIILDLTAANPKHGSSVGFMQTWNRLNVALTRAQRHLFIVGNLDCWRSELNLLGDCFRAKKLCYLIMDLLDLGDVIDVKNIPNALPADIDELRGGHDEWTRKMRAPGINEFDLGEKLEKMAEEYKGDAKVAYEAKLMKELRKKRLAATAFQAQFDAGEQVETQLDPQDDGNEEGGNQDGRDEGTSADGATDNTGTGETVPMDGIDEDSPEFQKALFESSANKIPAIDLAEDAETRLGVFQISEQNIFGSGPSTPSLGSDVTQRLPPGPYRPPQQFESKNGEGKNKAPGEKEKAMNAATWRRK